MVKGFKWKDETIFLVDSKYTLPYGCKFTPIQICLMNENECH
jgi:hypothetical protein